MWILIALLLTGLTGWRTYRIWQATPIDIVAWAILGSNGLLTILAAALTLHEMGLW